MDAAAILLALHGRVLRAACRHQGQHFQGVGAAGRHLFRAGTIPAKVKNQLLKLDVVCGFLRHASEPSAEHFYTSFIGLLDNVAASVVPDASKDGERDMCFTGGLDKMDGEQMDGEHAFGPTDLASTLHADAAAFVPATCDVTVSSLVQAEIASPALKRAKVVDVSDAFAVPSELPGAETTVMQEGKLPLRDAPDHMLEDTVKDIAKWVRGSLHAKATQLLNACEEEVSVHEVTGVAHDAIVMAFSATASKRFYDLEGDDRLRVLSMQAARDVARFWVQDLGSTANAPGVSSLRRAPDAGPPGGLRRDPGFGRGPRRTGRKR